MIGLVYLFVAGVWFFITLFIVIKLNRFLPESNWRFVIGLIFFGLILPLPLLDEIIGAQQFEQLCKENSTIQVDLQKAVGRRVYKADLPDIKITDKWIPITVQQWNFVDIDTDEPILSFNVLFASSGRFIRMLGISEGGVPVMVRSYCAPKEQIYSKENFEKLGIDRVERPNNKDRKLK
jgi:hypothetical protein